MNPKTVLFVIYKMNIGGVEKALLGVIDEFRADGWEVCVGMLDVGGGLLPYLPASVRVRKVEGFQQIRPVIHSPLRDLMKEALRKFRILKFFKYLYFYLCYKLTHTSLYLYKHEFRKIPRFSDETFDLAVAFAGPDAFIDYYIDRKVNAKEKWGWIHFDITRFGVDRGIMRDAYRRFSRINIVSEGAKTVFDKTFPQFACKTVYEPNIVSAERIREMAAASVDMPERGGRKVLVTVGRVSREKGQYMALAALKKLVGSGYDNVVWWFVGDGTDMASCRKYVEENGLADYALFLGAQTNPYPYMAAADIYIQPSVHEGFCITLAEAKIFGKPIITTDFVSAYEQLSVYPESAIVKFDEDKLADAIASFL